MRDIFRHRNGGGHILGTKGAIGSDCRLERGSYIEDSFISYKTSISKTSSVSNSSISLGDIENSAVINSHVSAALVSKSVLENVVASGTKERLAVIQGCYFSEVVIEACTLRNVELTGGPYHLHRDWDRTPRHLLLEPGNGVKLAINECLPGYADIGCKHRTISEWVEKKEILRQIFKKQGWTGREIDTIHDLFESWL